MTISPKAIVQPLIHGLSLLRVVLSDRPRLRDALKGAGRSGDALAASALVSESMVKPGKYFRNNVASGLNLLDAAVEAGVKRSSSAPLARPMSARRVPMTEDLPQRPINPYGESKLMFERMLHWYRQIHGLEFVALRYFNAAGASERFGEHHRIETHLIPTCSRSRWVSRPNAKFTAPITNAGWHLRPRLHSHR